MIIDTHYHLMNKGWDPTGEKAIKFMDEAGILGGNAQKLLGL